MKIKKKRTPFIHLHCHSRGSVGDGLNSFEDIIQRAKENGQPAIAITDHYYMYNLADFYYKAKEAGIKPIMGCELGIYPEGLSATLPKYDLGDDAKKNDKVVSYFHGVFLAKNMTGYKNLMKLASIASEDDRFYRKPRVKRKDIKKYHEGLIFSTACLASEVDKLILAGEDRYALKVIAWYHKIFGDDFYLEIQDHGIEAQEIVNEKLIKWARKYNLNLLLTNDTHYTTKELASSHRLLLCANWRQKFYDENSDINTKYFPTDEWYIKDDKEMYAIAKKWNCIDAYENTYKIYEKCNLEIPEETHFPKAQLEYCDNPDDELKYLIEKFKWNKYKKGKDCVYTATGERIETDVFNARIEKELSDTKLGKVADYFLNTYKGITKYCDENGIMIGAGRGSAAGSIISYILNITDVEPILLGLEWERFWNTGRCKFDEDGNIVSISLPDIDIDIPSDRRDEVMQHCREYFGEDRVANFITFGTYSGKNLVRAVGDALEIDKSVINKCCDYIPMSLSGALQSDEFLEYLEYDEEANALIEACKPLEGCIRNVSTHAAGMLIADKDMLNYTPYTYGKNGITTQYPYETMEHMGCLKVDLLGHEAEVFIDRACQYIYENHDVKIIPREIPNDDLKTFQMLQRCDSRGVPQIEKNWVLDIMKDIHPESINHIIDLVTMIRPGSLDSGQTDKYRAIRLGKIEAEPDIPQVENITGETYNCWLYQEQVMRATRELAGFTLEQADTLRKVVAKTKYADKAEGLMELFKEGCLKGKGTVGKLSHEEWEIMDKTIRDFFKYGFNKAHGAGYGITSYRCAYLKANYFIEFMTALINSKPKDDLPFYLDNIYEHGYIVNPPDINVCGYYWTCKDGELRPPLSVIRNCGPSAVSAIIEERELNGEYTSYEDFIARTPSNAVKQNTIESLIMAGVFDSMGYTRKTLHDSFLEEYHKDIRKNGITAELPTGGDEFTIGEIQEDEQFLFGFIISLSDEEIAKRQRKIIRHVKKYRDVKVSNSSGRVLEKAPDKKIRKSLNERKRKIMNEINEEMDSENVYIRVNSKSKKDLTKVYATVLKYSKLDKSKQYNVNFLCDVHDGNTYEINTDTSIGNKCYKALREKLGEDNVYIE